MGFYGNNIITHIPRSHFDIALTVANRKALDSPEVLEQLDIYDYVLVHYGDTESERQTNYAIDTANGFTYNYHNTIWQKGYKLVTSIVTNEDGSTERRQTTVMTMIAIAKLDSVLPTYYRNESAAVPLIHTINQVPVVVNEPLGYDNFGTTQATIPTDFNESGEEVLMTQFEKNGKTLNSPIVNQLASYGTETYSYLTH